MTKTQKTEPQVSAYNLTDAAEELAVSVTQVRRLVAQGRLEEVEDISAGRIRFVSAESVAAYKEKRKEEK